MDIYEIDDDKIYSLKDILMARGVEIICPSCNGLGVKVYGSTTTWAGGIGGQMMTSGVCDKCWGSGDSNKPGLNLKETYAKLKRLEKLEKDGE